MVDQWVDWNTTGLEPAVEAYMLPYYGLIPRVRAGHDAATEDVKKMTRVLDEQLKKNGGKFVVGQQLTLADIAIATNLAAPLQYVWDEKYRKSIQNITKWFQAVTSDEKWKKVVNIPSNPNFLDLRPCHPLPKGPRFLHGLA